jgi:hypothetical protein
MRRRGVGCVAAPGGRVLDGPRAAAARAQAHAPARRRAPGGRRRLAGDPSPAQVAEIMYQPFFVLNREGGFEIYVPLNKDCVKPIKGVKGFNGWFE